MEQLVTINLFGQPYTFRADKGCASPVEVANCLMEEVRKVEAHRSDNQGDLSKFTMLLVAALNIVSEHIKLKKDLEEITANVKKRSDELSDLLDNSVRQLTGISNSACSSSVSPFSTEIDQQAG
ncbi:MAG: cell division protein ZapA [Desulfobacterales bacterium]